MRNYSRMQTKSSACDEEDIFTESFPLMIILMTLVVVTVFQLLIFPWAKAFARLFI